MLRILSAFGLGGVFLLISPHLRADVMGQFARGVHALDLYAPYSYVGAGVLVLTLFCVSLKSGAQAR